MISKDKLSFLTFVVGIKTKTKTCLNTSLWVLLNLWPWVYVCLWTYNITIIITFMALKVDKTLVPPRDNLEFLHRTPIAALVLKVKCNGVLCRRITEILNQQAVGDWHLWHSQLSSLKFPLLAHLECFFKIWRQKFNQNVNPKRNIWVCCKVQICNNNNNKSNNNEYSKHLISAWTQLSAIGHCKL